MRRTVSCIILALLLMGTLTLAFNVGPVHAQGEEPIYINSDGSISPSDAPISSVDNVTYTFTSNMSYPTYRGIIVERSNIVIDGNGNTLQATYMPSWAGFSLTGVSNVTIQNVNIFNFFYAIYLNSSLSNTISGNTVTNGIGHSGDGIFLWNSSGNIVSGNTVTNSEDGVDVEYSSNNTVSANNATANWLGIYLFDSTDNTVSENNFSANNVGIDVEASSASNTFEDNNVTANSYGIHLGDSPSNMMYYNNFVGNGVQAAVDSASVGNVWDSGYPSGGNYWSDYNGTDVYSGPYQNVTGSDGIGDTPYAVNVNNIDHYPLMKPYPWDSHDLGVTFVGELWEPSCIILPLKTVVGLGCTLNINVFVMNYGNYSEIFNATVYANATEIGQTANVILGSRNSLILNFTWETVGLAYGNYVINAYVTPVPGETDTTDNNRTSTVYIGVPGDVDGNGIVNMGDIISILYAFGSTIGQPNYNENCDIDNNGRINMSDVMIALYNFGQHYP